MSESFETKMPESSADCIFSPRSFEKQSDGKTDGIVSVWIIGDNPVNDIERMYSVFQFLSWASTLREWIS